MLEAIIDEGASHRNAKINFKIPRSVLERHYKRKKGSANIKRQGAWAIGIGRRYQKTPRPDTVVV